MSDRRNRPRRERTRSAQAGNESDVAERRSRTNEKRNHKDLQVCREVFRTLSTSLTGGCGDDVLGGLAVRNVVPTPDASRVTVFLEPAAGAGSVDVADALARLMRVAPSLRRDVAGALARKRAPELQFVILPRTEVGRG